MRLHARAALPDDLVSAPPPSHQRAAYQAGPIRKTFAFVSKTFAIAEWEARKLLHDPTDILVRTVQPALWLLIFGVTFTRIRAIPTGNQSYLQFLAPGILAQSVLFLAIFYGIAITWERDLGVTHKFLASPTPRVALVLGKALSAGARALPQALIIYVLALALGVKMRWDPLDLLGVIASLLRTRDRVMGIGQLLTMPLFFASNAIYPIAIMPAWLQTIALVNPLTYLVDALRTMMVQGGESVFGLGLDFGVLITITTSFILLASRLYPKIVQ